MGDHGGDLELNVIGYGDSEKTPSQSTPVL
jgi:hypothetical protein